MLRDGFRKIFWGLILVLVEVHIVAFDLLPDPLGYFYILSGFNLLTSRYEMDRKGKWLAAGLILLSLPTIVIQNGVYDTILVSPAAIYISIMGILNLILAYFIFQLMISVAASIGDRRLEKQTSGTCRMYMVAIFLVCLFQSFRINMSSDQLTGLTLISFVFSLVMQLSLLMQVSTFSKLPDAPNWKPAG
ncbi:hypothetical protein J7E71_17210 [Mesobacillus foraminis]|uniref:hypothetical protein n=1 Tax=Mesobacillus foraminis TaxID=279826 RepID=UPI001BE7B251|nr:hypothetical protein [Mesobacillus foraminis]MBT2757631.1 hypothetical protein [Mesobacillus foraminis]